MTGHNPIITPNSNKSSQLQSSQAQSQPQSSQSVIFINSEPVQVAQPELTDNEKLRQAVLKYISSGNKGYIY